MRIPLSATRLAMCVVMLLLPMGSPCLAADASAQPPQITRYPFPPGAAVIFGTDNRTRVADTTAFPWSAIGQVVADYGNELHIGTGALIGRKTVLTAAHVIYDDIRGWPNSIVFIPGRNGRIQPFGRATAVERIVPDEWIRGNDDYDIGLLVLDREVGRQAGFLQLAVKEDSFFASQVLESAGYPSDLDQGDSMYTVTGPSIGVDGKMILERITTEHGQSGAPVWYMSGGSPLVVGLIVGWQEMTQPRGGIIAEGLATRIDYEFGALINNTLAEHGDVTQRNLPDADDVIPAPIPLLRCGAGVGQALLVISLAWTLCVVPRRGWRSRR